MRHYYCVIILSLCAVSRFARTINSSSSSAQMAQKSKRKGERRNGDTRTTSTHGCNEDNVNGAHLNGPNVDRYPPSVAFWSFCFCSLAAGLLMSGVCVCNVTQRQWMPRHYAVRNISLCHCWATVNPLLDPDAIFIYICPQTKQQPAITERIYLWMGKFNLFQQR